MKRRWIRLGGFGVLVVAAASLFLVSLRLGGLGLIAVALIAVAGFAYRLL